MSLSCIVQTLWQCQVIIEKTRDDVSTNCNPKVMSRCLSVPDDTSLHHCIKTKL